MLQNIVSSLAALLLLISTADAGTLSVIGQSRWVEVATVFDGDTFQTTESEKVRLLGINTPEIAHGKEPGQPLGKKAKQRLQQLISGKTVRMQMDIDQKDKYGRSLAHIFLRNGTWINEQLLREGMAHVYTFAPNFRWSAALLRSEAEARSAKRGIWSTRAFRILEAAKVTRRHIGQFRLVQGRVKNVKKWRFQMGKIIVSIPNSARKWFADIPLPKQGEQVLVRGQIRLFNEKLFLTLHSPYDLE